MSLLRRIPHKPDGESSGKPETSAVPGSPTAADARDQVPAAAGSAARTVSADNESESPADRKRRLQTQILAALDPLLVIDPAKTNDEVEALFDARLAEQWPGLSPDRSRLFEFVIAEVLGLGPLEALMADESIIEIMVNGPKAVYVNERGRLVRSQATFEDDAHVLRILNRMLKPVNRTIDAAHPVIKARLPDQSHLYAVTAPVARGGTTVTIRKYSRKRYTVEDLIRFGSLTENSAEYLRACVVARLNIVVSGRVGAGKTSVLNVLANFIPDDQRIFTIEHENELLLHQEQVIAWDSSAAATGTPGELTTADLVVQALAMSPDRVVVGDCRAGEAQALIDAMGMGYDGFLLSANSENPRDTLSRLEMMYAMGDSKRSSAVIRSQIAASIDLIVHVERLRDGSRRIAHITEVQGMDSDSIVLADIFEFEETHTETAPRIGYLRPTGLRPRSYGRLEAAGQHLTPVVFGILRRPPEPLHPEDPPKANAGDPPQNDTVTEAVDPDRPVSGS